MTVSVSAVLIGDEKQLRRKSRVRCTKVGVLSFIAADTD
jgi:hypothetical protein